MFAGRVPSTPVDVEGSHRDLKLSSGDTSGAGAGAGVAAIGAGAGAAPSAEDVVPKILEKKAMIIPVK
jgi:hypothetical protein